MAALPESGVAADAASAEIRLEGAERVQGSACCQSLIVRLRFEVIVSKCCIAACLHASCLGFIVLNTHC